MAYQTGTASTQTDLINKLQIFAVANGYTLDHYDGSTSCSVSRPADNVYVSFVWDSVNTIAMYQALGYSGAYATTPWDQANDSGNGNDNIPTDIDKGRQVSRIGNGPFTAYHFFAYTNPYAIHIVLEFSPGLHRHFAFGLLDKTGTWTGGAFCGGHLWNPATVGDPFAAYDIPDSDAHSILLDGALDNDTIHPNYDVYSQDAGGTLHIEDMPNQDVASKWGHCVSNRMTDANLGTDRDSNSRVRIQGGCRQGPAVHQYGPYLPNLANGFIPIIPMEVFYCDGQYAADGWYYLGRIANIGHIHLHGIDPGQELTIGAETWMAFPGVRKSNVGGQNQESRNMGIIYNKVV